MKVSSAVRRVLARGGFAIVRSGSPVSVGRGFSESLQYARTCGIEADVVYDVGAGIGTPWLYAAFPEARQVLFDPLPDHASELKSLYPGAEYEIHEIAIGAAETTATLHVPRGPNSKLTWSSLRTPTQKLRDFAVIRGVSLATEDLPVAVAPLDRYARTGRCVIKIDVEGSEMDVLRGAESLLRSCELLIIEMSVFPRAHGEARFADLIGYLDERGFELFDIPLITYPIPGRDLTFVDAFFVPSARRRAGRWMEGGSSAR